MRFALILAITRALTVEDDISGQEPQSLGELPTTDEELADDYLMEDPKADGFEILEELAHEPALLEVPRDELNAAISDMLAQKETILEAVPDADPALFEIDPK